MSELFQDIFGMQEMYAVYLCCTLELHCYMFLFIGQAICKDKMFGINIKAVH